MPRRVKQPLTDKAIRAFIAKVKAGAPVWRIKYLFDKTDKTDKTVSPGAYPEITLQMAREKRDWARAEVKAARDPIQVQRAERAANVAATATTIADMCAQWLALRQKKWSPSHCRTSAQALKRDILPAIGKLPISEIDTPTLAKVIRTVNARSESTAEKLCWSPVGIFDLEKVQEGSTSRENPERSSCRRLHTRLRQPQALRR